MVPALLLLLPALALGLSVPRSPEPIHVPLARRSLAGRDDMSFWAQAADQVRAKYGFPILQRRQSSAAVPILNQVCFFLRQFLSHKLTRCHVSSVIPITWGRSTLAPRTLCLSFPANLNLCEQTSDFLCHLGHWFLRPVGRLNGLYGLQCFDSLVRWLKV
jgi:hypothetical protein